MSLFYIFPLTSPWMSSEKSTQLDPAKLQGRSAIVTGRTAIGKTSLLFQAAVTSAAEDLTVTFICRKPLARLPLPVHGMPPPDPSTLQTVKFMDDVRKKEQVKKAGFSRADVLLHVPALANAFHAKL